MATPRKRLSKPKTVDQYLAALDDDQRDALERLRGIIRKAAPGAEEAISYGLPAFRLDGRWLIWYGASKTHCAIYGVTGEFQRELSAYATTGKGTIRFQPDHPLPAALVRKLVRARIARNAARRKRSVTRDRAR